MKAPSWKQQVLLVINDLDVRHQSLAVFGKESRCAVVENGTEAVTQLEKSDFQVLIIDEKALVDAHGNSPVSFLELTQYANQLNQGLTIIVLVNKILSQAGEFARKSGATLIMDRKDFSTERMIYVIRVMRKRTFRTVLIDDLNIDEMETDIYHYLPLSDRYAIAFPKNEPFSVARREKLQELKISHLFVLEADFNKLVHALQEKADQVGGHKPILTQQLSLIRDQYKKTLIALFDVSTDGNIHAGKVLYEEMMDLVSKIEVLVTSFKDYYECLEKLPYPRWSTLAHGINSAIYALVFAKICNLENTHEITMAALFHNVGLSEINQSLHDQSEAEMSIIELNVYKKHVSASLELLKQKRMVIPKTVELAIAQHHENYNGTGFPERLIGEAISPGARLLSIVGSFDYFASVKPKQKKKTPSEAWNELKNVQGPSQTLYSKFDPDFIAALDQFFRPTM